MLATLARMQAYTKNQYGERTVTSLESIIDDPTRLLIQARARSQAGPPAELDILSASRYPQALMQPYEQNPVRPKRKAATEGSPQLYGGLVLAVENDNKSNASSSAEPEVPRPKKKSKRAASNADEDGGNDNASKKQRGRPRLDTQDETAADRRRTQIRLAQRAYRHRKETTISALKHRVTELQSTIAQMNQTFITLHDNLVDGGILSSQPSLARQLKAASEQFFALAKVTSESDDEEEIKIAEMTGNEKSGRASSFTTEPLPDSNPDKRITRSRNNKASLKDLRYYSPNIQSDEGEVEELPLVDNSNSYSYMDSSDQAWSVNNDVMQFNVQIPDAQVSWGDVVSHDSENKTALPLANDLSPDQFSPVPEMYLERPLKSPMQNHGYTYSFQETTFARRLHRMCIERAFRNLTNPNIDPAYIKRVFRFTFCFSNRKRMLTRFQEMLKRRAGESLENWKVPFFGIGGAGTHFPRIDGATGLPIYPPNMVGPEQAFGPQPWIEVETPRSEESTQEMLEAIGFGGEWFDSHDVEGYLKTKGIFLDGQSSFVEVDPNALVFSPPVLMHSSSAGSIAPTTSEGRSPLLRTPSPLVPTNDTFIAAGDMGDLFGHQTLTQDHQPQHPALAFTDIKADQLFDQTSSWPWAAQPQQQESQQHILSPPFPTASFEDLLSQRASTAVTFDVERFLERMVDGSACLGRAPGFRKATIDQALAMSLQEAF